MNYRREWRWNKRRMAMVVNQIKPEDEDTFDLDFWLKRTPAERMAEVYRSRKLFYTSSDKPFPQKMERVVSFRRMI